MTGKSRIAGAVLALAAVLTAWGCGKDDGSGASKEEIIGSWSATSVEYASTSGSESIELIATGCTATLVMKSDNTLTYTETPTSGAPLVFNGTWELMGDVGDLMRVHPGGAEYYWAWDVEFSGNSLKLTNGGGNYDFNHDGTREPARWNLTLARTAKGWPPATPLI